MTMNLEDYFDFFSNDDIRLKSHRIGIEDIVKYYLQGYSAKEIISELPTLNLEKIYVTLAHYHQNKQNLDNYLLRLEGKREQHYQEWLVKPSPLIERLREAKANKISKKLL